MPETFLAFVPRPLPPVPPLQLDGNLFIFNSLSALITYSISSAIAETNVKTTYQGISLSCHVSEAYQTNDAWSKTFELVEMANLYASAKQKPTAIKLLDEALVSAPLISQIDVQAQVLINIALGYAKVEKFYEARQLSNYFIIGSY